MILYAGCKLNLGLRIVGKRPNGYHELDSCFIPLQEPYDTLDIYPIAGSGRLSISIDGAEIDPQSNILTRAYQILAHEFPSIPALHVHLTKAIPIGSGLGGGSSNAAALLRYFAKRFKIPIKKFYPAALKIGADVPFFLQHEPARVQGIGEKVTPCILTLNGYLLLIVVPKISITTAVAYKTFDTLPRENHSPEDDDFTFSLLIPFGNGVKEIPWSCHNDLERAVLPKNPDLALLKAEMLQKGAEACAMSGSGSSLYGLFPQSDLAEVNAYAKQLQARGFEVFTTLL